MVDFKEEEAKNIDSEDNQDLLAALHKAGSYTREQVEAKTREKFYNKRQRKKGKAPEKSKDLEKRKSTANELQQKLSKGETFMANVNNGKERNNVVGGNFARGTKVLDISSLGMPIKQPNLISCIKEFYLSEDDITALKERYALLRGTVASFNIDQIPTEEEYVQIHNTVAAVVVNYKVHNNWKIALTVTDEDGESRVVYKNYKEKRDKFPMLDTFGHALNQIGRWDNLDLGISVAPVWLDPNNIGVVEPGDVEVIAQKVVNLHQFAGIFADYGMACELGCNPDIMTTSEKKVSIDGEDFIEIKQFYKYVNLGEMVFASAYTRGPIKKRDGKIVSSERYQELYTCNYDKETLKDRDKKFLLSCLNRD